MRKSIVVTFALLLITAFAHAQMKPAPKPPAGATAPASGSPLVVTGAQRAQSGSFPRISQADAYKLYQQGKAVFVDVLPRPPKPDLPEGTVWQEPPHFDIPGSVWLPDVGYGALSPVMERWYRESLSKLTGGDKTRPLVIYCRAECWMSWNAARRAVEWGYANVVWFPGGTDEWEAAKLPLEERRPEPRPDTGQGG